MSDLYIFDRHDSLLSILSNETDNACPFWDAHFEEKINQGSTFQFSAPADHEDSQFIVDENQVAFKDKDGFFRLFVIKELEQTDGEAIPTITAICSAAITELNDDIITDKRPKDKSLAFALGEALNGTRWKLGTVADKGLNSTNFYYLPVSDAIVKCISIWGGEMRDRIVISGNKITDRILDVLPRRGENTGKRWEIDKDILKLTHKVQSYPKTALYGRGGSVPTTNEAGEETGGNGRKTTFEEVLWLIRSGDPADKPIGQEWVGDAEALAVYGRRNADGTLRHRMGVYESQETDPEKLIKETWAALQEQKKPINNYELDVFLLEDISGYEHEKVRLGDTTIAINRAFAKPIEQEERVIVYKYDVSDPDNTGVVELGDPISLYSEEDRMDEIEEKVDDTQDIVDEIKDDLEDIKEEVDAPIDDGDIEDVIPDVPIVTATGLFKSIMLEWQYVSAISLSHYEVYASKTAGFTPGPDNMVWKGDTGYYTHNAGAGETWYFRVRGVNTHGNASDYSEETTADTVRIWTDDILFGAVTAEKIKDLTITAAELAANAISPEKLAANAVTWEKIANAAVLTGKLSDLAVEATKLASNSVTTEKINNLAVGNAAIQNLAVSDAKIKDLAVTNAKISSLAVNTAEIAYSAITSARIAELAVGIAAIQNLAVTNAKIDRLAIDASQIQDLAVTTAKIGYLAVDNSKIANLSADKINVGTLNGIDIQGARFMSRDRYTQFTVESGSMELSGNYGRISITPESIMGYNSRGSNTFRMDSSLVNSSALGTSNYNVYLASSGGEARVVDFGNLPGNGEVSNYVYRNMRAGDFISQTGRMYSYYPTMELRTSYGEYFEVGSGYVKSPNAYSNTYADTVAHMVVTSAGTFGRSTSATKYKTNINEVPKENFKKLLNLLPKNWYDKGAVEKIAEYNTLKSTFDIEGNEKEVEEIPESFEIPFLQKGTGFIAEDVEKQGLTDYVIYGAADEEGNREIEGLAYDRLWTPLVPITKEHEERIEALEAADERKEARISNLEIRLADVEKAIIEFNLGGLLGGK